MNGRAAGEEIQSTVRFFAFGELGGHIAVFDDAASSGGHAEVAELFIGVGLGEHAAADIGLFEGVEADEKWIGGGDQRVVHLEVGDIFHPCGLHGIQRAGLAESQQGAAVPVRREGERVFRGQDELTVITDGGHSSLREEGDLSGLEAEEIVLLEKVASGSVVELAGHDEPWKPDGVFFGDPGDGFGEILEERFVQDGSDGIGPLGPVKPEARSLSTGYGEGGDFSLADELASGLGGSGVVRFSFRRVGREREEGGGSEVGGDIGFRFLEDIVGDEAGELVQVDIADLSFDIFTCGIGSGLQVLSQFCLAGITQAGNDLGIHFFR